ncbi:autophagy protein 12-like [Vespa mandarinia]|uniref:autophagy protein 12-like n=1 Tax=Vespa mandarinia TaxID=7446 RepID=UPI0016204EAD|nr:autophagy protein 12-like [Vespa mandarinia]XP_046819845.1 autophagy protein 12-like [Vespa crabro]XP_047349160.1 autophagy protein 12-like [Vespa velutina]XP_047349161.1 autophagy protein 12-like [Vespa velutina]
MAEKESDSTTSEVVKTEDLTDNTGNEEAPTSLETIAQDTNTTRNGGPPVTSKDKEKIDILLKATGNAPIMKQKKWSVNQDNQIGKISDFIRKYLKLESSERLFLYVNQTFAPAPDQTVKNLYDCYGADGKLIIHYCKSPAWG